MIHMRTPFIGRKRELAALEREYARNDALSSAVIYGRRRIGKSFLIERFIEGKKAVNFQATLDESSNLTELSRLIGEVIYGTEGLVFSSYDSALRAVFSYEGGEKLVFVIDEVPYIARKEEESFLSLLQRYMDQNGNNPSVMILLSGSSVSFFESEILSAGGPLYGRCHLRIELREFFLDESIAMLPSSWPLEEKIEGHVITGGIPYYLKAMKGHASMKEAMEAELFDSLGALFNEPRLFLSYEVRSFSTYDMILNQMAKGADTVTEIADKTHLDKNNVSAALNKLRTWRICGTRENIISKKGRSRWEIQDNFFAFYYSFIYPDRMRIENETPPDLGTLEEKIHLFISRAIEAFP